MLARMSVTSMLDREVYVYAEVDRLIGLHGGTARRWINGYARGGVVYEPILRVEPRDTPWVTWGEFVEARMLAEFRDRDKVRTSRLREAVTSLRRVYQIDYPLAHLKPYLDVQGHDITMTGAEVGLADAQVVVRTWQRLLGDAKWLADVAVLHNDDAGHAVFSQLPADRDFPDIVINPGRLSGQPTFNGSRVSPVTIAGMAKGGVAHEDLAADYGLSLQQVQQAIDYTEKYRLEAA
ncbi:hypothetical protein A5761_04385 [Mycolicibacterium setense]|uniref:DUF433 domain-containing protein n=1 Tax=Mycolicibacterium setense TaxID=431269 RepID=UPI0007E9430A|nr:DUF433 domain-containing protein [Mycolicibacterium setense]OBB20746.1 hypothetical protein A5761_04385 [Mycolicibacterium setense]